MLLRNKWLRYEILVYDWSKPFLFENEHVMVEELLQLFVCEVDAKLFEGIEVENFETSNI